MEKAPIIYVVAQSNGDRYHLWSVNLIAWFFDEREAEKWIHFNNLQNCKVEEVEAGTWNS